jgi:hypothetical protein
MSQITIFGGSKSWPKAVLGKVFTKFQANGNSGQSLFLWEGTTQGRTSPETFSDNDDTEEYFAWAGSATSGSRAGYVLTDIACNMLPNANGPATQFSYCPYANLRVQLSAITNLRFHWIIGNQSTSNNDNPWGAATTVNGGIGFNFLPASSANWRVVGKVADVAALNFNIDTGVAVAANTPYNLEVSIRGQADNRVTKFYINGVLVHTVTGDTSYTISNSGTAYSTSTISVYPSENVSKRVGISQCVWGRNASPRLAVNTGLAEWMADDTN